MGCYLGRCSANIEVYSRHITRSSASSVLRRVRDLSSDDEERSPAFADILVFRKLRNACMSLDWSGVVMDSLPFLFVGNIYPYRFIGTFSSNFRKRFILKTFSGTFTMISKPIRFHRTKRKRPNCKSALWKAICPNVGFWNFLIFFATTFLYGELKKVGTGGGWEASFFLPGRESQIWYG